MENYKNSYMSKEEYISYLIERVQFWAKAVAEEFRPAFVDALTNAEEMLVNEGYSWETVEAIEIAAYN